MTNKPTISEEIKQFYTGKDILVTGGCGSIGSSIVRQLLACNPKRVRIFDHHESGHFHLQHEHDQHPALRSLVGSIRDRKRLDMAMDGVDIVFHAAALKHVPLCEYNPFEAVHTNVLGTQNVVESAREHNVERVISISTDKAVNPINTMGATKLLGEKLVISASIGDTKTKFSCVRFGNVLNSDGSVIPLFQNQIKKGGPVTVTSPDMTRFCMSINDATNLVLKAGMKTQGREIFILKMPAFRIQDLAEVLVEELAPRHGKKPADILINHVGIRPAEKLSEALVTEEELECLNDEGDMYVLRPRINTPHFVEPVRKKGNIPAGEWWHSGKTKLLSKEELREHLRKENII